MDMDPFHDRSAVSLPPTSAAFSSPRTPEPFDRSSSPLQPGPPRIRIKRRRPGFNTADDLPVRPASAAHIPSIELSESAQAPAPAEPLRQPDESRLSPILGPVHLRLVTPPPRTPIAGSQPSLYDNGDWYSRVKFVAGAADISRPTSAFSQLSDSSSSYSSFSSTDTMTTDTCPTPDVERKASFNVDMPLASPLHFKPSRPHKAHKKAGEVRWTQEMDEHLWLTYMNYLSDPTVTPFKTLPGTAPPLGVCHRVSHAARKTWKGRRSRLGTVHEDGTPHFVSLEGTMRDGSAVPIAREGTQTPVATALPWPKESSTRKRLRLLCKHKPSLSPHYQRLMQSRSPSPFESSSSRKASSPATAKPRSSSPFSTRDLNFNLMTSTASSMQPSGPLARLSAERSSSDATIADAPQVLQQDQRAAMVHQKSQSLQHDSGFAMALDSPVRVSGRRLASPFVEAPPAAGPRRNTTTSSSYFPPPFPRPTPSLPVEPAVTAASSSPPPLHHPRPLSNSMKRRAQYPLGEEYLPAALLASLAQDGDEPAEVDPVARAEVLHSLFRDPEAAPGKRRVRSRGFSLGAMRGHNGAASASGPSAAEPSRHISNLFTPPSSENQPQPPPPLFGNPAAGPSFDNNGTSLRTTATRQRAAPYQIPSPSPSSPAPRASHPPSAFQPFSAHFGGTLAQRRANLNAHANASPRLGSPFSPHQASHPPMLAAQPLRNTFPRHAAPLGLAAGGPAEASVGMAGVEPSDMHAAANEFSQSGRMPEDVFGPATASASDANAGSGGGGSMQGVQLGQQHPAT